MTMLTDRVDDELIDAAGPRLRVVANFAVGYDNVDVPACTRRGVLVSNTPDVLTQATAELTMALLLALGRRVASLAQAFGMEVVHASRTSGLPLDRLLATADVVSLHLPLSAQTRHLIDERALSLMKPTAVLVNTSRGPIVDEAALARALAAGRIAGAALDVFEREPEVTEELLSFENVVLAPHLGSATLETREAMGMLCVEALRAVLLENRAPANALNPEALRAPP